MKYLLPVGSWHLFAFFALMASILAAQGIFEKPSQSNRSKTGIADSFDPRSAFRPGVLQVDVMEMVFPKRFYGLTTRMQHSMQKDPAWWLSHIKRSTLGQPLSYDPRFGITEDEYNAFIQLSEMPRMEKTAEAELHIAEKVRDVLTIDGGSALPELSQIEIDLRNNVVRTPFGALTEFTEVDASEKSAFGAWNGVRWKLQNLDSNEVTGTTVRLIIGFLKEPRRCVLDYDVRKISSDVKTKTRIVRTVYFDVSENVDE